MWLVEEAKKNMPLELDFLNEGRNAEKVADMLSHYAFLKVKWIRLTRRRARPQATDGTPTWHIRRALGAILD